MLKSYFKERISDTKLFKYEPSIDLVVGIITLILMWFSYYGVMNWYKSSLAGQLLIFIIFTNIFLNVVFPIWWVVVYKKQPISELGITKRFLTLSIAISIALAVWRGINLPELTQGVNWVPNLITSALIF